VNEAAAGPCVLCGRRLASGALVSELALRRFGITVLVPVLVWICATRGLGL
jgi:hypothetical protein